MSGHASTFLRDALLRQSFRNETLFTSSWLALTTTVADLNGDASGIDEPVGGNYARVQIPLGATHWGLTNFDQVFNIDVVTFPVPGNYWGHLIGYALCTAALNGNLLATGTLVNPQRVDLGTRAVVRAGGLVIGLKS